MSLRKVCPQCGAVYGAESRFCSVDGATLVLEQPADDLVGTIVADRYHILERIGIGGMGEVFLAEHVRMKRKSALKVMRDALTSDPIAVSRFHREAENASQISHPNVAAVYDFGETAGGLVYIAMEYIPGEPLSQVLEEEGALNPARVADIIAQAADALSAAHALGILHRDLKPDNIMLTSTRWGTDLVKLVDFGISRAMASATQQFTSTGMIVGTPDYMSPEQLTGDALDSRSDQYALGLIAYYALTGAFPFPAGASKDALLTRLTSTPRPLAEAKPDVAWPVALQAALDRALALDVNQRYEEVHEFGRDVEAAIAEMPGTETMERYREALRQRFTTPTRGPSVTPPRARPSIEATPVRPVPSVADGAAEPPLPAEAKAAAPVPATSSGHIRSRRPSLARRLTAIAATLALVAIAVWRLAPAREESAVARNPAAPNDSVAAPNAPQPSPAAGALLPALPLDSAAAAVRSGVFAVYGEGQQGTAFLVDSIGIVLTSAELGRVGEPRIQLEPERRVIGRLMAVDTTRGIAAFRIPIQHCRQCVVLRLATDSGTSLTPGDSLVVPAPSTRGGAAAQAKGALTRADGRNLQASVRLAERTTGAPVLASDRGVVALALRRGRGQTSLVPASALTALRLAALRRRRSVLSNDTLMPTWPSAPAPRAELRAAVARRDMPIQSYQAASEGFAVFVMTPHVMAWRDDRARQEIQGARVMSLDDSTVRAVDPVQLWPEWDAYIAERRAVVVLHVTPELAAYGRLNRRLVTDLKRGDVADVRLYRDGVLVRPIDSARIPAVVNADAYRAARREVYTAAIAAYPPRDFAPGGNGRAADMRVEIVDARTRRTVNVTLPEAALAAVRRDLAAYLR